MISPEVDTPFPECARAETEEDESSPLHREKQELDELLGSTYWAALCPWLHVGDVSFKGWSSPSLEPRNARSLQGRLDGDGYFTLPPGELPWGVSLEGLRRGVAQLMKHGWHPYFIGVYDEAWVMQKQLKEFIAGITGGNETIMDVLAWYIDPGPAPGASSSATAPCRRRLASKGFAPHRDRVRCNGNVPGSFRGPVAATGSKYTTVWVALTDAVPDNSCLYVVPRSADPGYATGDPPGGGDPLATAVATSGFQSVRALPLLAGGAAVFTHRILHWGGASRPGHPTPRVAMGFSFADPTWEAPQFSSRFLEGHSEGHPEGQETSAAVATDAAAEVPAAEPAAVPADAPPGALRRPPVGCPPVGLRVSLCAGQGILYSARPACAVHRHTLSLLHRLFKAHSSEFNAYYCGKVFSEFQWGAFKAKSQGSTTVSATSIEHPTEGKAEAGTWSAGGSA